MEARPSQVPSGLSSAEARARLTRDGPNAIARVQATPPWRIFLRQFQGALIWLLLAACAVSAALREVTDAIAIAAILLLNAIVGFLQEYRAERALFALRALTAPTARVLRDGRSMSVPAAEVVRGDLLQLEAGDLVPADARLLEAHALTTQEAALTGESLPVEKSSAPVEEDAPLAERTDRVYLGTSVAAGTALAEVFATGMRTELGRIAHLLQRTGETETPLQHRLERVGRLLLVICLGIVVATAGLSLARGLDWLEVLLSSVSLAVAAVPEGLAAMVTVALAVGVQRMARRHVLVRRLAAVETLGSATVICTDKTGTLTTGKMAVRELWTKDRRALLFAAAAVCDAELEGELGDPTEVALLRAAATEGIHRAEIERERPRVAVEPFDAATRRMSVLRADGRLYLKGALEAVLPVCREDTEGATEANAALASRGLRVLAVAEGQGPKPEGMRLLGLVGMADPPRKEAIEALAHSRRAGIRTVMITGDHPRTAEAIARELGLLREGDDPREWVHARSTAEEKLEIVRAWKERGAIVAMTGDGVNDAPALREAHIGIAMGRTGTQVTREASDMVLTDDNYASIVAAIREGRGVYDNIQKALVYLLAGNFSELLLMFVGSLFGLPLPLLPLQLLWINLVTDGLPALALVTDRPQEDVLERPPRPPARPILARPQWDSVALTGLLEGGVTIFAFVWALRFRDLQTARSLAFTTLVFGEVFRAFAARSPTRTFWETHIFGNLFLLAVGAVSIGAQLLLYAFPFTRALFDLSVLAAPERLLALGLGLIPVTALEVKKLLRRRGPRGRGPERSPGSGAPPARAPRSPAPAG